MARTFAIITMALTGFATMYAGSLGINPGDTLNADGSVSVGILPTDVTTPSNANGFTGTKSFVSRNYLTSNTVLGAGSVVTTLPQASSTCSSYPCQNTVYTPTAAPEFNLLGVGSVAQDSVTGNNNFWLSNGTGTGTNASEITIPVGIFDVTSVATLLNTAGGVTTGGTVDGNAADYAQIIFAFNATSATGGAGTVYETIDLINGVTQRNVVSGWCQQYCTGTSYATTLTPSYQITDPTTSARYTVTTGTEYTGTVTTQGSTSSGNTPPPVGTQMNLDYQIFPVFGEFANDYLVSVSITNTGTGNGASTYNTYSQEILSGISVETPEPATILMFLTGFGAIGLIRFRRKV